MTVVVHNATIIDGTPGQPITRGAVHIVDGRIAAIGPESGVARPADAQLLDAGGGTVIPGLINLHDHTHRKSVRLPGPKSSIHDRVLELMEQPDDYNALYIAHNVLAQLRSGVTLIRDFGSVGYTALAVRRAIAEGLMPGPQILAAGRPVCMTGGHGADWGCQEADGQDAVRRAVREQIKRGADCIKLMASGGLGGFPDEDVNITELSFEELAAGVEEAHKFHKKTSAHAYPTGAIKNAVLAGIDSIEHGAFIDEEMIILMKERNVALVPTVSGLIPVAFMLREKGRLDHYETIMSGVIEPQAANLRLAFESGLKIGTGSDTTGEIVEEMELLQEAGDLSALDTIRMATRISAEIAGVEHETGTLEVGKHADLVIIDGQPLDRLGDLRKPRWVMARGKIFDGEPMPLGIRLRTLGTATTPAAS